MHSPLHMNIHKANTSNEECYSISTPLSAEDANTATKSENVVKHVEMLLPPVIGTTTFSSRILSPLRVASNVTNLPVEYKTHNIDTASTISTTKIRPLITKPINSLEPIMCNKKFGIHNRLQSLSSYNALSSSSTTTTTTTSITTSELEQTTALSTSNKTKELINEINSNANNYKGNTTTDIDTNNDCNVILIGDSIAGFNTVREQISVHSVKVESPKDNRVVKQMSPVRNSKLASPHFVFSRLTQSNHEDNKHENEENDHLVSCVRDRINKENNRLDGEDDDDDRDNKNDNYKSNSTNNRLCKSERKEQGTELEMEENEKQRIAILQQFHHDVDVIANKGKELVRPQSCNSTHLASSLSKWRERIGALTSQSFDMTKSYLDGNSNNSNYCSNNINNNDMHSRYVDDDDNYSHQTFSFSKTMPLGMCVNKSSFMDVETNDHPKQFIVPFNTDIESDEEEEDEEHVLEEQKCEEQATDENNSKYCSEHEDICTSVSNVHSKLADKFVPVNCKHNINNVGGCNKDNYIISTSTNQVNNREDERTTVANCQKNVVCLNGLQERDDNNTINKYTKFNRGKRKTRTNCRRQLIEEVESKM